MTFNASIPQSTDNISTSQGQLLTNNQFLGSTAGRTANGFYIMPNGLIFNWGLANVSNGSSGTDITFNQAYTNSANVFNIQLTIVKNTSTGQGGSTRSIFVNPGSITTTKFTAKLVSSDTPLPVYWFAIGF